MDRAANQIPVETHLKQAGESCTHGLNRWTQALARAQRGYPPRPLACYGSTNAGRHALLAAFADHAKSNQWWTAHIDGNSEEPLLPKIQKQLRDTIAGTCKESYAPSLEHYVQGMCTAAQTAHNSGLAVLVDDVQTLDQPELLELCVVAHRAAQRCWRFGLVISGPQNLPKITAEARS